MLNVLLNSIWKEGCMLMKFKTACLCVSVKKRIGDEFHPDYLFVLEQAALIIGNHHKEPTAAECTWLLRTVFYSIGR